MNISSLSPASGRYHPQPAAAQANQPTTGNKAAVQSVQQEITAHVLNQIQDQQKLLVEKLILAPQQHRVDILV